MKREVRLRCHSDFIRVQRTGKPFSHPLFVMRVLPNDENTPRFGISVSKKVGGAVTRNKVRRRVRAIIDQIDLSVMPKFDVVISCRSACKTATFDEMTDSILAIFAQAGYPKRTDEQS